MPRLFSRGGYAGEHSAQHFVTPALESDVNPQDDTPRMRSRWTPKYQLHSTVGDNGKTVITIVGSITLKTMPADGTFGSKMTVSKLVIDADQSVHVTIVPTLDEPTGGYGAVRSTTSSSSGRRSATGISAYEDPFGPVTNQKGKMTPAYGEIRGQKSGGRALSFTEACLQASAEKKKRALNPLAVEFVPVSTGTAKPAVGLSGLSSVNTTRSTFHDGSRTLPSLNQAEAKPALGSDTGSNKYHEYYLGMPGAVQPPNAAAIPKGQENWYLKEIDFEKGVKQEHDVFAKSSASGEARDKNDFQFVLQTGGMFGKKTTPHPKVTKDSQLAISKTKLADSAISASPSNSSSSSDDTIGSDISQKTI